MHGVRDIFVVPAVRQFHLFRMAANAKRKRTGRQKQLISKSAAKAYPRSAYDEVGGIVYFARMLHKIRLYAAGRLPPDYHKNLSIGFDGRCSRFLRVDYAALRERVLQGGTDEQILQWCFAKGRQPNDEEILIWNAFMRKRGWRDEGDGTTKELEHYKGQSGLSHRHDLLTLFDYYEVDEGRKK
jgi:gluconokinase